MTQLSVNMKKVLFRALFSVTIIGCQEPEPFHNPAEKIVIEASMEGNWINQPVGNTGLKDGLELKYVSTQSVTFKPAFRSIKGEIKAGKAIWTFYSHEPVKAVFVSGVLSFISPGDSIHISLQGNRAFYSGKGSEKINLLERVKEESEKLSPPTKASFIIASVEDYLRWDNYTVGKEGIQLFLLDSFRYKLRQPEYEYLKTELISTAELDRLNAFEDLLNEFAHQRLPGTSRTDICNIWDSTQYRTTGKWLRRLTGFNGSIYVISLFNEMEVQRRFGFDVKNDSLHSRGNRNYLYYTTAKKNYAGLLRERLMAYILAQDVIPKMDPGNSIREWIIQDYYSQPGFPEYKQMIKDIQKKKDKIKS